MEGEKQGVHVDEVNAYRTVTATVNKLVATRGWEGRTNGTRQDSEITITAQEGTEILGVIEGRGIMATEQSIEIAHVDEG